MKIVQQTISSDQATKTIFFHFYQIDLEINAQFLSSKSECIPWMSLSVNILKFIKEIIQILLAQVQMDQCPQQPVQDALVKLTNPQKQYEYPEAYQAMQTLTQSFNISIDNGEWLIKKCHMLCEHCQQWSVENGIYLQNNKHPIILKEIQMISFRKLTVLELGGNKIVSIEPLSRMNLPELEILGIGQNMISNLKPLQKLESTKLNILSVVNNEAQQINFITTFRGENIEELVIDYYQVPTKISSLIPLVKQRGKLAELMIDGQTRIRQNILLNNIQKKLPDLTIY